ncbi:hypothetical protein NL676_023375 [Syzygium grande]|nr:hypothetical protein NL676_023375 [Syzygium grande]
MVGCTPPPSAPRPHSALGAAAREGHASCGRRRSRLTGRVCPPVTMCRRQDDGSRTDPADPDPTRPGSRPDPDLDSTRPDR